VIQLVEEYGVTLRIELFPSSKNIADGMTRIPKRWLDGGTVVAMGLVDNAVVGMGLVENVVQQVTQLHNDHHRGVQRTAFLVGKQLEA